MHRRISFLLACFVLCVAVATGHVRLAVAGALAIEASYLLDTNHDESESMDSVQNQGKPKEEKSKQETRIKISPKKDVVPPPPDDTPPPTPKPPKPAK
jgi:outer membrane biosynthesis protein TonB